MKKKKKKKKKKEPIFFCNLKIKLINNINRYSLIINI